jgi:formate dehydrogenase subunit gamma
VREETLSKQKSRLARWALLAPLLAVIVAPLPGYFFSTAAIAQGNAEQQANERANFWRAVREGVSGYTAVQGQETNVLIQNTGENWRNLRNGPIATYGGWILGGVVLLIAVFFILFGRIKLADGRSGYTIERWGLFDRVLHWFTAISFIVLALTGLSLLYGRVVLIPYLGKDGFAAYANFAKELHNYLGPFFAVSLVLQLLKWMRHNFPTFADIAWLLKGGGLLIKSVHPSAGRMNAGEKVWYWILFWLGLGLIISGFVLDFPNFGQTRETMQYAQIIHTSVAIILIAIALGHIYIGTLGTEGALEGMVTGRVDVNWAKQHHDLWYQELQEQGVQPEKPPELPVTTGQVPRAL